MRTCRDCGETKSLEDFSKAKQARDGIRNFCKACAVKKMKAWSVANPDKIKAIEARRRLKRYGLSDRTDLGPEQCGACGSAENLCVDHDHSCCGIGKACSECVRGWLCRDCNTALGLLRDSPERITQLYKYITRRNS